MAAGTTRKITAASARAHTRKPKARASSSRLSGLLKKTLLILVAGILAWGYQAVKPPPPTTCGSGNGPPVTGPRVQLKDGRHLAYKEFGVPRDTANHKIVFIHGFDCSRHDGSVLTSTLSPEFVESKRIYILSFDRPGYGESDPNPARGVDGVARDVEELADLLGLGSKFYIIGFSMGGQIGWTCLKYIPHRLAGAALLAPVANYWWAGIPSNVSKSAYLLQPMQDQWAVSVAHYLPWLTYWWNTQRWFPSSAVIDHNPSVFNEHDKELLPKFISFAKEYEGYPRQQGEYESLHRDMMIGFGKWDFSPLDLKNPFPNGEGSVHLWHGGDDRMVPVTMQRYIAQQLPWIHFHEVPGAGHMFPYADGMADSIVQALLA
ncbi:probable lysophospholipase BODYGUARD 1 isoform X2 [Andrographis paniculata]|uniref:probable lysophospholipase BODYGUARD 1 isoform X2 n=1 Tax=Andrographis paniculata TaxID=175694 RepID=UPI0021E93D34|nr:probable lysophospholipase BODYGUARD 1 isoform X2 [Andrographis paniculata]